MPAAKKYLKGHLLLDSGQLSGSFFQRTVVLICQHDSEGAFGLVLNRASGATVGSVLVADLPESIRSSPLYIGGPVQPTAMSYLLLDHGKAGAPVIPRVSIGHSMEGLDEAAGEGAEDIASKIRLYAGYAGWSPNQLEDEIARDAWLTHPATVELVFNKDPLELWRTVLKSKGPKYKILSQMPDDLSTN